jgi:hypothetical protein
LNNVIYNNNRLFAGAFELGCSAFLALTST